MINCPNCQKKIDIDRVVYMNCENYGNSQLAVSRCCGTAYIVTPRVSYELTPYTGTKTEDNWGNPIKQSIKNLKP